MAQLTQLYYSGGSSSFGPETSLGGQISDEHIPPAEFYQDSGDLSGFTVLAMEGFLDFDSVTLHYDSSAQTLQASMGGLLDLAVPIYDCNQTHYLLPCGRGRVQVILESLPSEDLTATYLVGNTPDGLFPSLSILSLPPGDTVTYRCLYLKNTSNDVLPSVNLALPQPSQPSGAILEFGQDPAGIGDGESTGVASTIPDESTAPALVDFFDWYTSITIGPMLPDECFPFWVRLTLNPANTTGAQDRPIIEVQLP